MDTSRISSPTVAAAVKRHFPRVVDDLKHLVTIPGIAWDAFDPAELDRSARAVADLLRPLGFDTVEILTADAGGREGAPAVVARKAAAAGKPTILLYAHHDVQPPGDEALWDTPVFEATEVDGRLYGRGAADDKAGIMAHVGALRVLNELVGEDHGLGVTVFIEGEEEAGSPSFRNFLEKYRDKLASDVIVVADSGNWNIGTPALTTSLRGLAAATMELSVLDHAVHSGMFGGPVVDALTVMCRIIATFHDEAGNVAIEGLTGYDDAQVDYAEEQFRADSSLLPGVALAGGGSISSRLWTKPAMSVIGIDAPAVDVASNTLIPKARAKFSLRVAPGQDPMEALEAVKAHVRAHAPWGVEVEFSDVEGGKAFIADIDSPAAVAARWAMAAAWGTEPVAMGQGGSIPFTADLTEVFPAAEILITGVEDPDSRAHSANESLHLDEFRKAVTAEALLLAKLGGHAG